MLIHTRGEHARIDFACARNGITSDVQKYVTLQNLDVC